MPYFHVLYPNAQWHLTPTSTPLTPPPCVPLYPLFLSAPPPHFLRQGSSPPDAETSGTFPTPRKFSSIGQGHSVLGKQAVQSCDRRSQEGELDFFPMTIPISTQDVRVFLGSPEDLSSSCCLSHRALLPFSLPTTPASPGSAATPLGKASQNSRNDPQLKRLLSGDRDLSQVIR